MYKFLKMSSFVLVLIGALNWGLVGLFRFDLVARLFGEMSMLTRIIYILVGLSAIVSGILRVCVIRNIIAIINLQNDYAIKGLAVKPQAP